MGLDAIILGEIIQTQGDKCHIFFHVQFDFESSDVCILLKKSIEVRKLVRGQSGEACTVWERECNGMGGQEGEIEYSGMGGDRKGEIEQEL